MADYGVISRSGLCCVFEAVCGLASDVGIFTPEAETVITALVRAFDIHPDLPASSGVVVSVVEPERLMDGNGKGGRLSWAAIKNQLEVSSE